MNEETNRMEPITHEASQQWWRMWKLNARVCIFLTLPHFVQLNFWNLCMLVFLGDYLLFASLCCCSRDGYPTRRGSPTPFFVSTQFWMCLTSSTCNTGRNQIQRSPLWSIWTLRKTSTTMSEWLDWELIGGHSWCPWSLVIGFPTRLF